MAKLSPTRGADNWDFITSQEAKYHVLYLDLFELAEGDVQWAFAVPRDRYDWLSVPVNTTESDNG